MAQLITYPRHFISVNSAADGGVSTGDAEINSLWRLYDNPGTNTASWLFRKHVLFAAIRLFGDFEHWVGLQQAVPALVGYNRQFLDDTIQYISTGKRKMEVATWLMLLDEQDGNRSPTVHCNAPSTPSQSHRTVKVLSQWCSHPGGANDLMKTLFVFFGQTVRTPGN